MKVLYFLFTLLLVPGYVTYASNEGHADPASKFSGDKSQRNPPSWYRRFQPYDMNYAIWRRAEHDQDAVNVQYSFRYNVWDDDDRAGFHKNDLYLAYTGKFDFYMMTRDSSPVINRTSNPAIHFRHSVDRDKAPILKTLGGTYAWIDAAVEHRSNGQANDAKKKDTNPVSPTFGQYLTQIEDGKRNHAYFDGISRSTNYLSFLGGFQFGERGSAELQCKVFYFGNESDITWGRYAGRDMEFSDFDRFRVKLAKTFSFGDSVLRDVTFGLDYLIGDKGFYTHSVDLYLVLPVYVGTDWNFPLFVKSHFGPMERLSNYSEPINTIGFGFAMSY